MGYVLGSFVPLLGGGFVVADQRSGTVSGSPSIDLYVQLYDANKLAIGSSVVVAQAFSNGLTGRFATVTGYDLAASPLGGFAVVYTGSASAGNGAPTFELQGGNMFDAQGRTTSNFTYYGVNIPVTPHLIPLANGGLIIQQDWSAWFYDANGKELAQLASPTKSDFHDLLNVIAMTTTRSDGTIDQLMLRLDAAGLTMTGSAIVKTLSGTAGADVLLGTTGPDIISGGAGNDVLTGGLGYDVLTGGAGADRFVFGLDGSIDWVTDFDPATDTVQLTNVQGGALPAAPAGAITFDARSHALYWDDDGAAGAHTPVLVAVLDGVGRIEKANILGVQPAVLTNIVGFGSYEVTGGAGDDTLAGGAANDSIDGGAGWDTVVLSGARSDYSWAQSASGVVTIKDNRAQGSDGVDTLAHVEVLQFKDQKVTLGPTTVADALAFGLPGVLRETTLTGAELVWRDSLLAQPGLSVNRAVAAIVSHAAATTSVATLAYQFFTGKMPGEAGMDYLVSPTGSNPNNLNSAYYQSFNLENRYINFAVNLGKNGEGHDRFQAAYGALNLHDATKLAYQTIFGAAPSDAKVDSLLTSGRADYFAAYGLDGANGLGTKAAMVGWLLAEAVKADVGMYAQSNDSFLTELVMHRASFGVDLVGVYGGPIFIYNPG